jgi:cytochrome c-type biogenesis protein CcmH
MIYVRSILRSFILCGLVLAAGIAHAIDPGEMFDDPAKEARAREIGRALRCMVCQNQSIFDSNAGLAKDLRVLVRQRMEAGDTDQEIIDFVAARYGDYVLLEPPVAARTVLLWVAPALFLLIGIGAFASYHRRRSVTTGLDDGERAAAKKILEGESQ